MAGATRTTGPEPAATGSCVSGEVPDPDPKLGIPVPAGERSSLSPIRYNDWHRIAVPPPASFEPELPVSVIVPYYRQPGELSRALAALEGQTWPRGLFEVVVVDDGSPEPLEQPASTPLDVKVVRQENRGFGAARARNAGVRRAAHDILLFLDADMLPERDWLAAHARWHHAVRDALTQGLRTYVALDGIDAAAVRNRPGTLADLFAGCRTEPEWFDPYLRMTDDLVSKSDNMFHIVSSCSLGVRRAFFDLVGGFNESLTQWGGEDTEFGYRAHARGGLLIPVRDGIAWHQGLWSEGREQKERALQRNMAVLAHTIAHPQFRNDASKRAFVVPRVVVAMQVGAVAAEQVLAAVVRVLSGSLHDLIVRLELPEDYPEREILHRHLDPDRRVQVAPSRPVLDMFPTAQLHVELAASRWVHAHVVRGLCVGMGDAVVGRTQLPDGTTASVTRIWALHRAQRTASAVADCGDSVRIPYSRLRSIAGRASLATGFVHGAWSRMCAEWHRVANLRTAWLYGKWLGAAVMRRVRWRLAAVRRPGKG